MKTSAWWILFTVSLVASTVASIFPSHNWKGGFERQLGNAVPNQFIVEVQDVDDIPSKRDEIYSREAHETLYAHLKKRKVGFTVKKEFNNKQYFVGASIALDDRQQIASIPGVKAVRPVISLSIPKPVKTHVVTGIDDPELPPDIESTHILTGVDKLHAQNITGTGVKIGIIDTGVDYTHPVLGGGIGPGYKIIGGYDFVGDNYDGTNTPVPDDDPLDQCNGHGTHVAGIIGANPGNEFNISGVAYGASLTSYRVFGCAGGTTDDILIEALLRGVSDGQEVLTLSIGGSDGWTESSSAVVASRISASGKVVTMAAGNDGGKGTFFTSSPANAIDSISVASSDNTVVPLQNLTVHGVQHDPITYYSTFPFPTNSTLPIYATSNDTNVLDDACDFLPDGTPDLSSFLVVVKRGNCTLTQKLTNIAAKGAQYSLIYDDGSGFTAVQVGNFTATLIQQQDGIFLVNQFARGINVTISFPQVGASYQFPDPAGGLMSTYSSFGPTNDMFFKPAVAAPGGNILSTLPVTMGSFGVESGTSMATPFIAGVSALLFGVKGNNTVVGTGARDLLETTAQMLASDHSDSGPLQSAAVQGAGLVNAFAAVHADVIVSPGEILLNDTANFNSSHTFSVKNTGTSIKSFRLTHVPAGTLLSLQPGTALFADNPPFSNISMDVTFSESSFTVQVGQTQMLTANFTIPPGIDQRVLPIFSGFIEITNTDNTTAESYHVSYIGAGAPLKNVQIVDNTDTFFGVNLPALGAPDGTFISGPSNFTFVGNDIPYLISRLDFGSPEFRLDLVDSNVTLTPTIPTKRGVDGRRVFERETFTFPKDSKSKGGSFAQVQTLGSLFEYNFVPRNSDVNDGTGYSATAISNIFANGTTVPNGTYRVLLRVLKVTGDPTNEDDFVSWLSDTIDFHAPTNATSSVV
ncbi:pyrolysin [Abortiporus biennis]|nr:pyrolysin [Abortiporus biennis]